MNLKHLDTETKLPEQPEVPPGRGLLGTSLKGVGNDGTKNFVSLPLATWLSHLVMVV